MGLPRLSLKRCFIYIFCATGMILVVMNVRQKELWHALRQDSGPAQSNRAVSDVNKGNLTYNSSLQTPTFGTHPYVFSLPSASRITREQQHPFTLIYDTPAVKNTTENFRSQMKLSVPSKPKGPPTMRASSVKSKSSVKKFEPSNLTGTVSPLESIAELMDPSKRPWYMKGGSKRPLPVVRSKRTGRRIARLWPDEDSNDDRVTNQLMFVPPDYNRTSIDQRPKRIMIPHGMGEAKTGSDIFHQLGCPVNTCVITRDTPDTADLIIFKDYVTHVGRRPPNQAWMLYFLECPYHTQAVKNVLVNWTATYRRDSDIVAPYERWQYYDARVTQISQTFNYAANKTKKVAWFVSNCHPRNQRMQYAKELAKHIQVDIYGACGSLRCSRSQAQTCFEMLDADYKFYLAFENSNCRDYITEKFFVNGLGHNVLPIVMGAHPTDYAKSAPYRSYIHVDEFESPRELADYLHRLDHDDELYNSYFKWKGTGEFINTYFWCRVCAMLHDPRQPKYYKDVNEWWRGDDVCTQNSWRGHDNNEITFKNS